MRRVVAGSLLLWASAWAPAVWAQANTPGYAEKILHWTVQPGETCAAISSALYGDARHAPLLRRYNSVDCARPLAAGRTLVVPAKVTQLATAELRSMAPEVRARSPGGGWAPASAGMGLHENHAVNTLSRARANIVFIDRTRVYLAENTLVVIYDTARRTQVTKTPPARVELSSGEVQAGLAALRGGAVEVAVTGGGHVSASSKEAAVRKTGTRSTVSVFDGHANVRSGGRQVKVPEEHGSAFVDAQAPSAPRPLPPPPSLLPQSSAGVVLIPKEGGTLQATWSEVPRAVSYRVELSTTPDFADLVVREEVPSKVQAFVARQMPPGTYHLRVRALDDEDFLGIASTRRDVTLVSANVLGGGKIGGGEIQAHPYGVLELGKTADVEVALDDGAFSAVPQRMDLLVLAPMSLAFRSVGGSEVQRFPVRYLPVSAQIAWAVPNDAHHRDVVVHLLGFEGIDVASRVAPRLRVRNASGGRQLSLNPSPSPTELRATLPGEGPFALDVLDSRGRVLGSAELTRDATTELTPAIDAPRPVGLVAPLLIPSRALSMMWWSPTAENAGALAVVGATDGSGTGGQVHAQARGQHGAFGVDALVASEGAGDAPDAEDAAWLGVRWRAARIGSAVELAPAVRIGVPTASDGAPARVELGAALAARLGGVGVLGNLGGRAKLDDTGDGVTPDTQGFVFAGATHDVARWLTTYAVVDGHVLARDKQLVPRAGLALGLQLGTTVVGSFGLRGAPFEADGGYLQAQLALGVREALP